MKTFSKMRLLLLRTSEHEFYFAYVIIRIINDTNVLQTYDVAYYLAKRER